MYDVFKNIDTKNPVELAKVRDNIQFICSILFDTEIEIDYPSYDTNAIVKINRELKSFELMVGDVLIQVARHELNILPKSTSFDTDIHELMIKQVELKLIQKYFKNTYPYYYDEFISKIINHMFDYSFSRVKFRHMDKVDLKQYANDIFNENNEQTSYYKILTNQHSILDDLTDDISMNGYVLSESEVRSLESEFDRKTAHNSTDNSTDNDFTECNMEALQKIQIILNSLKSFIVGDKTSYKSLPKRTYSQIKTINYSIKNEAIESEYLDCPVNVSYFDLTLDNITTNDYGIFEPHVTKHEYNQLLIEDGIKIGKRILNHLQYVDDSTLHEYTNLNVGDLDMSKIHQFTYDPVGIYKMMEQSEQGYKKVVLSIDMSRSINPIYPDMLRFISSLIYAFHNVEKLDLVIYCRTTGSVSNGSKKVDKMTQPILLKLFDTSTDNISDIYNLKYLKPNGGSPEGIIHQYMYDKNMLNDIYTYILITDGIPEFYNNYINYSGTTAIEHTKDIINKLKTQLHIKPFNIGSEPHQSFYDIYPNGIAVDIDNFHNLSTIISELFIETE